jgi:hypothetical protein
MLFPHHDQRRLASGNAGSRAVDVTLKRRCRAGRTCSAHPFFHQASIPCPQFRAAGAFSVTHSPVGRMKTACGPTNGFGSR